MPALTKIDLNLIINKLNTSIEDFPCFVETGTWFGDTTWTMVDLFKKIYTIEFSQSIYEDAKNRFKNINNVNCLNGDSSKVLPNLLEDINENIIFWLDGHYSMGNTGLSDKSCPLLEECEAIDNKFKGAKSIIMIDDTRQFGNVYHDGIIDWSEITETSILNCFKKLKVVEYFYISSEICENDRMIILVEQS